jgi:hypothetical protein
MTAQIGMFAQSASTLLDAQHYLGARGARGFIGGEE